MGLVRYLLHRAKLLFLRLESIIDIVNKSLSVSAVMKFSILSFLLPVWVASSLVASDIDVLHYDRGWYRSSGSHIPANDNYIVSESYSSGHRNFFVFDLSSVTDVVTSASLILDAFSPSSPTVVGDYTLYSYEGSVNSLINGTGGTAAYADLASGDVFGGLNSGFGSSSYEIRLNSTALNYINNSSGLFAIGGIFTGSGHLFGYSSSNDPSVLSLTTTPIPEPSTIALALGVVCAAFVAKRKNGVSEGNRV